MTTRYGSTDANEKAVPVENDINPEVWLRPRRWCRLNQNIVYGLGHVYNDLCAAMWFSYMMLFFQAVLEMRAAVAGAMLLLGQVIDALATPVVGILADRYGTKKKWHLTGCILVTCTFPLLFIRCWGCQPGVVSYLAWWMPTYYAILIVVFQIGWAIVQISHLAMIPTISDNLHVRSELTSIRYMASVTSSLMVYLVTWIVLRTTNYSTFITPADDYKFRDVSMIISSIGIASYSLFHIIFKIRLKNAKTNGQTVNNGTTTSLLPEDGAEPIVITQSKIMHFLKMPLLYQTSLLYVFSRLYWALSLVYVPLFLEERLSVNPSAGSELVASVPLVLYISSFFFSLLLKSKINIYGHQVVYLIGSTLSLISCLWIALAIDPEANIAQIYLVATLIGAGSSITLVSSLCVTADLIGPHSHQSAAIYSIVTFADKLVTGIAVVAIENYKCDNTLDCPQYYRGVLTYACGGSALLGILSLIIAKISLSRKE
ncbi:major facilitator superfamily domain-containing protein 12 [Amyelois transitella]|uniref:major facilitator superfamily domain-containing protein 12 n=1 Tax=Amyelois transitella TaxID=680683 RepID=UPI002990179B|nr:major facilitator superfamily domain-containing protein 12 [Amyelois transitella]